MNNQILIWGASGHARVVADILRLNGCEVAGFLDDMNPAKHGMRFCGSSIIGGKEKLKTLKESGVERICIGIGIGSARLEVSAIAEAMGFTLVSAIHPSAILASDSQISPGTVIAAGAIINPN